MPSLVEDYGPLLESLYFPNSGVLGKENACEAAKFHAPKPMVVRRVSLTPWGKSQALETAWVCGICADLLAMYQQFLRHFGGNIPYDISNRFAPSLRRLALRGWQLYQDESRAKGQ
jgi:hypothetical protein